MSDNESESRDSKSNVKVDPKATRGKGQQPNRVMALAGNIEPFLPGLNFESYEDRMEQYFIANDVKQEKKSSMFITLAGEDIYNILRSLTHPKKPSELAYREMLKGTSLIKLFKSPVRSSVSLL